MNDEEHQDKIEFVSITDRQIFTLIWTKPRIVFRYLEENSYDKFLYGLLIMAGIGSTLNNASNKNMGDEHSLTFVLAMSVIFGGLLGWISFYIGAALMSWTGKWIDGKATRESLLRMSAYASIPVAFSLIIITIQIAIFGNDLFKSQIYLENYSAIEVILFYLLALSEVIIGVWTIAIFVIGLSEVQGFSVWKAIANIFISMGVVLVPVLLLVALLTGFN
ncbi:Yip1 family protein [Ekhidna sp.]|uniref:Yip1 family protein n=1 Tax=Ekhidna sp. TaxID=2608089 RepID=UPI0032F07A02